MKKTLVILLSFLMLLCLFGCDSSSPHSSSDDPVSKDAISETEKEKDTDKEEETIKEVSEEETEVETEKIEEVKTTKKIEEVKTTKKVEEVKKTEKVEEETLRTRNLGVREIRDGQTLDLLTGDIVVLSNTNRPSVTPTSYSYSWSISEGKDLVEMEIIGSTCTYKALKSGKSVVKATLTYTADGKTYTETSTVTVNITKSPTSSSSSGSSGSSSSGSSGGYTGGYTGSSSSSRCSWCGGKGYTTCITCNGKGYYEVRVDPPNYDGKYTPAYTETKDCTSFYCNGGKRDCPHC